MSEQIEQDAPYGLCPTCGTELENWGAASHGDGDIFDEIGCPVCEEVVDKIHAPYCQCVDCKPEWDDDICSICGCTLEWEDCWNGCDEGYFDGYDEDPLWYDPGDLIRCSECGGRGGYLACPNAENHATEKAGEP